MVQPFLTLVVSLMDGNYTIACLCALFCLSQVVLPTLSPLGVIALCSGGYLGEEGRRKDIGSLKRIRRVGDEEEWGRAWVDPAVTGMIQINYREGLAWIPSPNSRLWVEQTCQTTF